MTTKLGFIGLGRMGLPMARNLLEAGFALTVWNRTPERAQPLLAAGAQWAESPAAVARETGAVLSMLADDAALEAVALGPQGVLAGLGEGGVHCDLSTVAPDTAEALGRRYAEGDRHYVQAPVFGRPEAAAARALVVCPAGPAAARERLAPVFAALGRAVVTAGDAPRQAAVLKLTGNLFVISAIETLAEGYALAERGGVSPQTVLELVRLFIPAPLFTGYGERLAERSYRPAGFSLPLGMKDVRHMRHLAEQQSMPLPLADVAWDHLAAALHQVGPDADWGALYEAMRRAAGLDGGEPSP